MPAVCTGRSYFWEFMIHLNRAAIKKPGRISGHQSVQSEDRRSDPVYQPAPDRISGRRFSLFPGLSEQILYDAPLQSGNWIYHRKLYHLPQAFACPHFDPGWDADHAGLPCKRLSGLLHIFTSLQNRIYTNHPERFYITLTEMSQTEFPSVFLFRYHSPHLPLHCEAALHASRWRVPALCAAPCLLWNDFYPLCRTAQRFAPDALSVSRSRYHSPEHFGPFSVLPTQTETLPPSTLYLIAFSQIL